MIQAVNYCNKHKTLLQAIHLHTQYDEKHGASLFKEYCPKCNIIELTGDDIDYFIYGYKPEGE